MRYGMFLLVWLGLRSITIGQNCQVLWSNYVDEFTGDTTYATWGQLVGGTFSAETMTMTFTRVNAALYLDPVFNTSGPKSLVIGDGDPLYLKLDNDSIVIVRSTNIFTGKFKTEFNVTVSQITPRYRITLDQIRQLAAHRIARVRMQFSDGYREFDVKERAGTFLSDQVRCVIESRSVW